jgi:hypothetical protein
LIDYKYVFLSVMGYSARKVILDSYLTIGHARLFFCKGYYADNLAFHLSSGLWWLSLFVSSGLAIWLCVQHAVHALGWVRTEGGIRLPLPPRFYPSSVIGIWWFSDVCSYTYSNCFVNVAIVRSFPEHAHHKAIAGGVAFVMLAYSMSRWLFSIFTDQEDISTARTERFFGLLQGCVVASMLRETIKIYFSSSSVFRPVYLILYGLPIFSVLVINGSVVSFGRQKVFDRVSGWLEIFFALCGRRRSAASEIARHAQSEKEG